MRTKLAVIAALLTIAVACSSDAKPATTANASASLPPGVVIGGTSEDTGSLAFPAPPPDQVARLTEAAGLRLEQKESLVHHVHAHLDVFIDGEHRTVPAGIGIVITDPAVHTGEADGQPAYGGIEGCDERCISPLHTHDVSGILHTESLTADDNTLGQFFTQWDVRLDDTCVGQFCTPATAIALFVNGQPTPLAGAAAIRLTTGKEIALVIGTPPARIPDSADFSKA